MKRNVIGALLLLLGLSGCNYPARAIPADRMEKLTTPTSTDVPAPPDSMAPLVLPSDTPAPSPTGSPTPTQDLTPASMQSAGGDLLCRFGPGLRYGVGGSLQAGTQVVITARNGAGDWFQFELPGFPGKYCWVFGNDVEMTGNLSALPIAEAPFSFVTNVSVLLDPLVFEPTTCVFPLTFNVTFSIETIGPTFVTFQRSQSNGMSAPSETVEFTESGAKVYEDYLQVDAAGEHWFRVSVSSPNAISGQGAGTVVCP